jgi:hypothetical protein
MAGAYRRSRVELASELAVLAQEASLRGNHREAAELYRSALLVLYNPATTAGAASERPAAAELPHQGLGERFAR